MLNVTEKAVEAIREHMLQQKLSSSIRISVMHGSCSGPNLRISADQAREDDHIAVYQDIQFIINRKLLTECGAIQVDFVEESTKCICSGGCGGFCISGEKKFLFTDRCNKIGLCNSVCKCEAFLSENEPG
jgi:iron-sulfur cluster assembly protein